MDQKGHITDQKGIKMYEKRQKMKFSDLKYLPFRGIFLSGIGGYPPPPHNGKSSCPVIHWVKGWILQSSRSLHLTHHCLSDRINSVWSWCERQLTFLLFVFAFLCICILWLRTCIFYSVFVFRGRILIHLKKSIDGGVCSFCRRRSGVDWCGGGASWLRAVYTSSPVDHQHPPAAV